MLIIDQVRVVQHKHTKTLFALKYINKAKCVKMKAVANIVQERRLLEEVSDLADHCIPDTSQYRNGLVLRIGIMVLIIASRLTTHLSLIYATPSRTTRTAFLF